MFAGGERSLKEDMATAWRDGPDHCKVCSAALSRDKEDMATRRWADIKAKRFSSEKMAEIRRQADADVLEMNLRALRETIGLTQEELAARAEMSQSQLSRFEKRDDHLLSTLRRYVHALGGEIEVTAVLDGKRIALRGV